MHDQINLDEIRRVVPLAGRERWLAEPEGDNDDGPWQVTIGSGDETRVAGRGLSRADAHFWVVAASSWADVCAELERARAQRDAALAALQPLDSARAAEIEAMLPPLPPGEWVEQLREFFRRHPGTET